ncbi:TerC family protein [Buchnera aphidicola]|uniref:TerC family protein n=1 Tax=Buchnera aphidicola TaxID=9 RepID=UPI0030EDE4BE
MTVLLDPSGLTGLFVFVMIEIILSVDNLIFLSILSEKLPSFQRKQARYLGLILSFLMRLSLLFITSWALSIKNDKILIFKNFSSSIKSIILFLGSTFLIIKVLLELLERAKHKPNKIVKKNKRYQSFWLVIIQIVILDAIFSVDSIITAVGLTNNLMIMYFSVTCATIVMIFGSQKLVKFLKSNPKIITICLFFLLFVGINLFCKSINYAFSQAYLYTSIGFIIFVELFNKIFKKNIPKYKNKNLVRKKLFKLIKKTILIEEKKLKNKENSLFKKNKNNLKNEEIYTIQNILKLSNRTVKNIMIPRKKISWININDSSKNIKKKLLENTYNFYPVCKNNLNNIIGIIKTKKLIFLLNKKKSKIKKFVKKNPPCIISETMNIIDLLKFFKNSKKNFYIIVNKFGIVKGLITPLNFLKTIIENFNLINKNPNILVKKNGWIVPGSTDLHSIQKILNIDFKKQNFFVKNMFKEKSSCTSLAHLIIQKKGRVLKKGEKFFIGNFKFCIIKSTKNKINTIKITKK